MPEGAIYAVLKQVKTTTAPILLVSQKVLDASCDRKGCIIFNDSANSAYITYGTTAVITGATTIIGPYASWEMTGPAVWNGEVHAIREAGSGSLVITDMI